MSKKVLSMFAIAALIVGVMATGALASPQLNAGNTTIAAEVIPPATATAPAHIAVQTAYQPDTPIAGSTKINVTLTNGKFTSGEVAIYDPVNHTVMGSGTVDTTGNSVVIQLGNNQPLSTGTAYTIVDYDGSSASSFLTVDVKGLTAGATVTLKVDSYDTPGDPAIFATATVAKVRNEISAEIKKVTSKLDFATGMESFVDDTGSVTKAPNTSDKDSNAALYFYDDTSIVKNLGWSSSYTTEPIRNTTLGVKVRISGDLTGLSKVIYDNGGSAQKDKDITDTDRTNGYVDVELENGVMIAKKNSTWDPDEIASLTLETDKSETLATGDRTIEVTLEHQDSGPVYAPDRVLIPAGTVSHTFVLNATQYYLPLIGHDAANGRETYIKIQSKSEVSGANGVRVTILCDDGSTVNYDAGTVQAGKPLTITGADLANAVAAAGKTVGDSFAAIVTVNAPEKDLFVYANIIDPNGAKRVPCKAVNGKIVE